MEYYRALCCAASGLAVAIAAGGCTALEPDATSAAHGDLSASDAEYFPEDDAVGDVGTGVIRTLDELYAERTAHEAWLSDRRSKASWLARVGDLAPRSSVILIGQLEADLGGAYGASLHAAHVAVIEQLSGPELGAKAITVVQGGLNGEPYSCGGLFWRPGQNVALVVTPGEEDSAYRLFLHFDSEETLGWAAEIEPGVFKLPSGDDTISRAELVALGGAL